MFLADEDQGDARPKTIALWKARRVEIFTAIDKAGASIERGEGIATSVDHLIADVKRRGQARLLGHGK